MVDHIKTLGAKIILPKASLAVFGLFLFLWTLPVQQTLIIRTIPFQDWVFMIWLSIVGTWNILEGMASMPSAKSGNARGAGYLMIGIGVTALVLAVVAIAFGSDILLDSELAFLVVIVIFVAVIQWFVHVGKETYHQKSFVRSLN